MTNSAERAAGPLDLLRAGELRRARRSLIKKIGKRAIRRLSTFLGRQSLVGDRAVFDAADFPWAAGLEAAAPAIRRELDAVLTRADDLPAFHEISPDQRRISKGADWKTFILFGFGYKSAANCAACPETTAALEKIPGLRTAFFSILAPRYHIPRHQGVTKGLLRAHLGLIVPADAETCEMRIADETVVWREGRLEIFDDTHPHEVRNDADAQRVVLLLDVDRPMRFWGRVVSRAFLAGIRSSAYVQDARRNLRASEARFKAAGDAAGPKESPH